MVQGLGPGLIHQQIYSTYIYPFSPLPVLAFSHTAVCVTSSRISFVLNVPHCNFILCTLELILKDIEILFHSLFKEMIRLMILKDLHNTPLGDLFSS